MATVWRYPLQPMPYATGTAVTAAALTSGLGGLALPQIPPQYLFPGARLSLRASGEVSWTSTGGTVVLDFRIGSVGQAIGSKTVLAASASLSITAAAAAWPFDMELNGTFRALSPSAGSVHLHGKVFWWGNVGLTGTGTPNPMPVTAAARLVSTLNTDQVNELDLGVTLSSVTGTPSVSVTDFWAEISG